MNKRFYIKGHPYPAVFQSPGACTVLFFSMLTCCAPSPRWISSSGTNTDEIKQVLEGSEADSGILQSASHSFPDIPMRMRLRPCCTLGDRIETSAVRETSPWSIAENIRSLSNLGTHTYDSGALRVNFSKIPALLSHEENNGIVYTCRGGFIDTAQVRDYADWTVYLATRFGRRMTGDYVLHIPRVGALVRIRLKPIPRKIIEQHGRRKLAVMLARWTAGKLALWHEIATWYGWSVLPDHSERSSSFSPEDLYSKMLGINLGAALALRNLERTETVYNRSMTQWLEEALKYLGAVERQVGRSAIFDVQGVWWDGASQVGKADYLLRRNLDMGEKIVPWLVRPKSPWLSNELRRTCGPDPKPAVLHNPESIENLRFSNWVTVEFILEKRMARMAPFHKIGAPFTQESLDSVVENIRRQILKRFGEHSDRPYPPREKAPQKDIVPKKNHRKMIRDKHIPLEQKEDEQEKTEQIQEQKEDEQKKDKQMQKEKELQKIQTREHHIHEEHINEEQFKKGHIKEKQKKEMIDE